MTFTLIHLSDTHFGAAADLRQISALEALVPDLEPQAIALTGDLTLRARHGEYQRALAHITELERSAPVHVVPGNHDVQWWWRPMIPFANGKKLEKYRRYFGDPGRITKLPQAVIATALSAHGVTWGSLTFRVRDLAVKGHLPGGEMRRVAELFRQTEQEKIRILALHHNVLRGELSRRMGLARWRRAQRRIVASGADLVLCGHDHQEQADALDGVVISCAGTVSQRSRGGRPSSFHRIVVDDRAIHVERYRWDEGPGIFRRSDVHQFARRRAVEDRNVAAVGSPKS